MKVILNPGHSATAPGVRGPVGLSEREVVEDVARLVARHLGQRMVKAEIMQQPPGEDDQEALQALADRIADEPYDIDLIVSIHCGHGPEPTAYGARAIHQDGSRDGRLLAECLLSGFPKTQWSGVEAGDDILLQQAQCPAARIELDFISNPEVEVLMRSESWREKVAGNVADGIFSFLGPQDIRIMVDGLVIYCDPAPQEVYNDVMVPVRVLGSALGAQVRWDKRRRVVAIDSGQPGRDRGPTP